MNSKSSDNFPYLTQEEREYLEISIVFGKKDDFQFHNLLEWIKKCNEEDYFVVPESGSFQRWSYYE